MLTDQAFQGCPGDFLGFVEVPAGAQGLKYPVIE